MGSTPTLVDDREFVNAVPLSDEDKAQNKAYFESKGYEIRSEEAEKPPEEPKPAEQKTGDGSEDKGTEAAGETPAGSAALVQEDPAVDAEMRADWQSAQNDGERLGKYAKRTKKLRELEGQVSEKDRRIAELEGRLAGQPPATTSPLSPEVTAPKTEPPKTETVAAEAPKAKEFEKPRPAVPSRKDFLETEDPEEAYAAALVKHTEDLTDWKLEKRDFERTEQQRVEAEAQQQQETQKQQSTRVESAKQRYQEARTAHSDFDAVTTKAQYSPILRYLLMEELQEGFELGYQLGTPEHAEELRKLMEYTNVDPKDQKAMFAAIDRAKQDLAVFNYKLSLGKPPAETPAAAKPAVNGHAASQQTPSAPAAERREPPAPTPVKGRTATTGVRVEDVDPMDSDERRRLRKLAGAM